MAFTKIVDSDLNDIGVIGLPDRPGLSTSAMQAKLEETARSVIIPKHNGLIDELEATTGAASLGMQTPTGFTGATVQTVVDDIAEKVMQLDPESLSSKADKVTNAVEGNFAGLDSEGNLTDSGNKAADFAAASHTHTKSEIIDFPTLATVATTGAYADLSGKPTLGTASALDVPASGNASSSQVVKGNDSRLSDDRNAADVYSWAKQSTKPSYTASEVGAIASTEKGANGGVAELDSNGKVPSAQLPSYVDDVEEYASLSDFPATGETGKIYIAKDTNKQYRWSGTAYVEISESLALGETSSTAYAGNKGKANADAISAIKDGATIDSFGDVETALGDYIQKSSTAGLVKNDGTIDTTSYVSDISGKADKVSSATSGNFAGLDSNGNLTDSGNKASDFLTQHQDISGKADKVASATNGNFAGLDSNGNLTDSGSKASDFLTQHQDISGKQDKTLSAQVEGQSTVEGALGALSSKKVGWDVAGKSVKKNYANMIGTIAKQSGSVVSNVTQKSMKLDCTNVTYGSSATNVPLIDGKDYILSFDVTAISGSAESNGRGTFRLGNSTMVQVECHSVGSYSLEFTFHTDYYLSFIITGSTAATGSITVDNVMIRPAEIADSAYAPPIYDNTELEAKKTDNSVIAPVENGPTASQAYSVAQHFIKDGAFCTATTTIAYGETLTEGTNYTKGDVASEFGLYIPIANNAGFHNSIFRGKNLGSALTATQLASIAAGTFDDMFIGDYWVINGVTWRIAHFDYWLKCGDTGGVGFCQTHHVVVVPDNVLNYKNMNDKVNNADVTTGAYINSKMYTTNIADARTIVKNAFGESNILTHREYFANATNANGFESGGSWYDSQIDLMNEIMVYGSNIFHNCINGTSWPTNYTIDKVQLALFRLDQSYTIALNPQGTDRTSWWLRDVCNTTNFANVSASGFANTNGASSGYGVRPAFGIKGA